MQHPEMRKWDERFLGLAQHIAGWSKDPSTRVGAVITDGYNRIVSVGYNGLPRRLRDTPDRLNDRTVKYLHTVHAEVNAILFAGKSLHNCTLYTWPFPPCARCASIIIQSGIIKVVAPATPEDILDRWKGDLELAEEAFKEAGVFLDIVQNVNTN